MTSTMTAEQARDVRTGHDILARVLTKRTRASLDTEYRANHPGIWYRSMTKDELVNALVHDRYPIERLNEAIHVLYHGPGERWPSCDWCSQVMQDAMDALS